MIPSRLRLDNARATLFNDMEEKDKRKEKNT